MNAHVRTGGEVALQHSLSDVVDVEKFRHGKQCKKCSGTLRYRISRQCVACKAVYRATPKMKAAQRAYRATPKYKELKRKHDATPHRKEVRRIYNARPERLVVRRAYLRQYITTPAGLTKVMLKSAKHRAKAKNIAFDLDPVSIENRVRSGFCEATRLPFDMSPICKGSRRPFAPSIDRTDSTKGYTIDNVRVVCYIFNIAKNEFSESELLVMARAMARNAGDEK